MNVKKIGIIVLLGVLLLTGCNSKEPFFEKKNIKTVNPNQKFKIPVYCVITDLDRNIIDTKDFNCNPNTMTYEIKDLKLEESDKKDREKLSFKIELDMTFKYNFKDFKDEWTIDTHFIRPNIFDYYTGEIYRENIIEYTDDVSDLGKGVAEDKNELKYTNIKWNDKTIKIGVLHKGLTSEYGNDKFLDYKDGFSYFQRNTKMTEEIIIEYPKDYDGLLLALYKGGMNKKDVENNIKNYKKLVKLQLEERDTGKKSKELEKLENDNNKVRKLVDPFDKERRGFKIDDFYIIRIMDIPELKEEEKETKIEEAKEEEAKEE